MPFKSNLPVWTSLLYLPADAAVASPEPLGSRPDAVVLDLEDFVHPGDKDAARARLGELADKFARAGVDALVRINRPLDLAVRDIDRAVVEDVKAIMVTKVASADHLALLDELVSSLEARRGLPVGHTRLVAMIESAQGLANIEGIAGSVDRLAALVLGGEDLALECGMRPGRHTLSYPKQKLVHAAAAAGILPWGYLTSVADSSNREAFRAMVWDSREFGFVAATCVSAMQVSALNEIYVPTPAELDRARAILSPPAQANASPATAEERNRAKHTLARARQSVDPA